MLDAIARALRDSKPSHIDCKGKKCVVGVGGAKAEDLTIEETQQRRKDADEWEAERAKPRRLTLEERIAALEAKAK
jgi:hypothetical protein